MRFRFVGWAACVVLLGVSPAQADYLDVDGACVYGGSCSSTECILEGGAPGTCLTSPLGEIECVPDGASPCCNTNAECGPLAGCFPFTFFSLGGGFTGICIPNGPRYCMRGDATRVQCHTSPTGDAPVNYDLGDCDGDGRANAIDPNPCLAAPDWGIEEGGVCDPVPECNFEDDCDTAHGEDGMCSGTTGTGYLCRPLDDKQALFCADRGYTCPLATRVVRVGDHEYCVPALCPAEMDYDCLTVGDVPVAVPWFDGDCDNDGEANGTEADGGRNPCRDESLPDAGISVDAGTDAGPSEPADAGPAPDSGIADSGIRDAGLADAGSADAGRAGGDASMPFDAGTEREINFEGGGGCACRAAPTAPGSTAWLAVGLVGLLFSRRRRRRP
ncbi:MAG: MYXO-CTERM sorting domain-containing protein [Sandaracinaceae bacterium]